MVSVLNEVFVEGTGFGPIYNYLIFTRSVKIPSADLR